MEAIIAASITGLTSVIAALIQLYSVYLQSRATAAATSPNAPAPKFADASRSASLVTPRRVRAKAEVASRASFAEPSPPAAVAPAPRVMCPSSAPAAPPVGQRKPRSGNLDRFWWVIGILLGAEVIIFGIANQDLTPFVNSLCLIPLSTLGLAIFRPAKIAYVAAYVTILHTIALSGYLLGGGRFGPGDIEGILWLYCGNVAVCAVAAFLRTRATQKAV